MTTANLLNVSSVKTVQVDVSKKLQEEAREVTEIFATMMNQSVDLASQNVDDASSDNGVSRTEGTQEIADSYERFGYRENKIEAAKENSDVSSTSEELEEQLHQVEDTILSKISQEYGVDLDRLQGLLDKLGLKALDLLNPQNLVSFIMNLTEVSTGEELLLDESFQKVMETVDALSNALMKEFSLDKEGLLSLIVTKDIPSVQDEIPLQQLQDVVIDNANANAVIPESDKTKADITENEKALMENEKMVQDVASAKEVADDTADGLKIIVDKVLPKESNSKTTNAQILEQGLVDEVKQDSEQSLFDNHSKGNDFLKNQENGSNQVFVTNQPTNSVGQFSEMPQMQLNSYLSMDTMQIMEQIAEQIRVVVTPDTTSMEMQLNPENLGKIYLHISTEEGVVSAQFTATNEVVKEALELQMVTLRENLNQAGVKVDAIEVTVASHEFEKNLEQNQKEPNENLPEEKTAKRRNLSVDSLDDLMGIMTEEETLVAQIMKDNGNSVDFTA